VRPHQPSGIRRASRFDLVALAAWSLVLAGAALTLVGADEISRTPRGESVEAARALVLVGVLLAIAGGAACRVLARGGR